MKLLTKTITARLERTPLYSTDGKPASDRQVVARFFNPSGLGTWYVLEGEKDGDDWLFFGLVSLFETELGYFRLSELAELKVPPFGLGIERDLHWSGTLEDAEKENQQ